MSRITNQKDLRREFWRTAGHGLPRRKTVKFGDERHYPTDTRTAFVNFLDAMQKGGEISPELAQRATLGNLEGTMAMGEGSMVNLGDGDDSLGGFGEDQPLTMAAAMPALIGGGSAAVVVAGVRGLAPAGSFWEKHAGGIGAVAGSIIALAAKQGGAAVAAALLVGVAVEGIEYLTTAKMTAG